MDTLFATSHPSVRRFAAGIATNDDYLKKIAAVSQVNGSSSLTLNDITFDTVHGEIKDIEATLKQWGVVCLTNVVDAKLLNGLNARASTLFSEVGVQANQNLNSDFGETPDWAWQRNLSKAKDFNSLIDFEKPMVNIRGSAGSDTGMMDVFNLQKLSLLTEEQGFAKLYEFFTKGLAQQIVSAVSSFSYSNVQMYENRSVTDTRSFHIDNIFGTYKIFVYLSDVKSNRDGPYCYIPGSHRLPYLHRLELRQTERTGIRPRDILSSKYLPCMKFIAPRGTVIISNQTGIHRGFPQQPGASRRVLVANYSDHIKMGRKY